MSFETSGATKTCSQEHPNPAASAYCGTCGEALGIQIPRQPERVASAFTEPASQPEPSAFSTGQPYQASVAHPPPFTDGHYPEPTSTEGVAQTPEKAEPSRAGRRLVLIGVGIGLLIPFVQAIVSLVFDHVYYLALGWNGLLIRYAWYWSLNDPIILSVSASGLIGLGLLLMIGFITLKSSPKHGNVASAAGLFLIVLTLLKGTGFQFLSIGGGWWYLDQYTPVLALELIAAILITVGGFMVVSTSRTRARNVSLSNEPVHAVPFNQVSLYGLPPQAAQKTNVLAIASLSLAILGLLICGPLSLVGLILGHISRRDIKRSGGYETGSGLALAGLIIGYLSVAAWAVFVIAVFAVGY